MNDKLYKNRDWLYEQYIVLGLSSNDIAKIFGINKHRIHEQLKKFGIKKDNFKLYHDSNWLYEQYIIKNLSLNDICKLCNTKRTIVRIWIKKFNLEKDKKKIWEHRKEKTKKNNLENYGVEWPALNSDVNEKTRRTCLEKYGSISSAQNPLIKQKTKENNIKKYGVDHPCKLKQIKEKIGQKTKQTWLNKTEQEKKEIWLKQHNTKKLNGDYLESKSENRFFDFLAKFIDPFTERQVLCKGFSIDFYLSLYDIYIQFDGDYWHGYNNAKEELEKTLRGRNILETMMRDEIQNNLIPNLIRIKESEFLTKSPEVLVDLILERIKKKIQDPHLF